MNARTLHELEPAAEWRAGDVADPASWTLRLDAADHAELAAALAVAKRKSADPLELERDDFPLDGLAAKLRGVVDVLLNGRGFARIATLETARYSDDDLTLLYWGIGLHLGEPWAQNKYGHVLGDVTDQGKTIDDPTVRGNELGGIALDYHTDGSDLVGLLCLRAARSGGLSCVANAVAIHNQLVRERPDLAAALYESLPYDARGEQPDGARAFYSVPAFTEHAGRLFVRFIPQYILASQRHPDAPRLSPTAREAIADGLRPGQRPGLQRLHGPAAGRDAVHQQLPRAPWPHRLRGRRGERLQATPEAAVAGHLRADRPAGALRRARAPQPLGGPAIREQPAGRRAGRRRDVGAGSEAPGRRRPWRGAWGVGRGASTPVISPALCAHPLNPPTIFPHYKRIGL